MRSATIIRRRLAILLAAFIGTGCSMSFSEALEPPGFESVDYCPKVTGVQVARSEVAARVGEEVLLTAFTRDEGGNATALCPAPTWSSSDVGALSVSADGRAIAHVQGTHWAYARHLDFRDSVRIVATLAPAAVIAAAIAPDSGSTPAVGS